jgi:hypothetical protein
LRARRRLSNRGGDRGRGSLGVGFVWRSRQALCVLIFRAHRLESPVTTGGRSEVSDVMRGKTLNSEPRGIYSTSRNLLGIFPPPSESTSHSAQYLILLGYLSNSPATLPTSNSPSISLSSIQNSSSPITCASLFVCCSPAIYSMST